MSYYHQYGHPQLAFSQFGQAVGPGFAGYPDLGTAHASQHARVTTQSHTVGIAVNVQGGNPSRAGLTYLVRVIPMKKSEAQTYEWHGVHEVFTSPTMLKAKLVDSFRDKLPSSLEEFQLGYIGKRNVKRAVQSDLDLTSMYKQVGEENVLTLYCEVKSASNENKRKRKTPTEDSEEDHEGQVKEAAKNLLDVHGDKYDSRQLKLWGRMIVNKQWQSYDEPPDVPLITGGAKKVPRRESLSEAVTGAAVAFAKAISTPSKPGQQPPKPAVQSGVSPHSKARLSSEYITQLKALQELRETGVISEDEFVEQKTFALNKIRSMNKKKD